MALCMHHRNVLCCRNSVYVPFIFLGARNLNKRGSSGTVRQILPEMAFPERAIMSHFDLQVDCWSRKLVPDFVVTLQWLGFINTRFVNISLRCNGEKS